MRIVFFLLSAVATIALVVILNTTKLLPAPLAKLLSPQHGLWQNAENSNEDFSADLSFSQLTSNTTAYLDERLVPHIFSENENDAYFVQGYLHAKFRLWQMEFQTLAAAGELSKLIGSKALDHDREFRRLGMVYAAEIAMKEMEKDPEIKAECDAYTAGVNAWIAAITESTLPIEYKLIGYKPTPWTNLKTSLFLKYMSYDLASAEDDFEMTNAKSYFSASDFDKLFPAIQDSLDPIIPRGTPYAPQTVFPVPPKNADSLYFNTKALVAAKANKPDRGNGSNNWAVSGTKTKTGAPILCNDPHLGLNLPSLWFEMQLSTPAFNAYGASFPGAPGIIIGYNDSTAFGFTNGGRDVRDYYEITFKDDSRNEYLFNGTYHPTRFRVDTILVKDELPFIDSVAYVQLGRDWCPVMFDKNYSGGRTTNKKNYAVRWTAHDVSQDIKIFNLLNHAKNYADYEAAAAFLSTPGQNCVFASKAGDIAIKTQGSWPAKWKGQGDFVMPGTDSNYLWQGMIPQTEIPFQLNPERGFVSSANQKPVAEDYPYYIGRAYPQFRGITINKKLSQMSSITVADMQALQTNNLDGFAAFVLPALLSHVKDSLLDSGELKYLDTLKKWNLMDDVGSKGAVVFEVFWKCFFDTVYNDEYKNAPLIIQRPYESTLAEAILKDSSYLFVNNIFTPETESLDNMATAAFKQATKLLKTSAGASGMLWEKYNNVGIGHVARIDAFGRLGLTTGGGSHAINANRQRHGPSWRMIVSLTAETEAYGVYPGGQNGNPASKFYDDFVDTWAASKYYKLWMMKKTETTDKRIRWVMNFKKQS